jgi:hypothetical protein
VIDNLVFFRKKNFQNLFLILSVFCYLAGESDETGMPALEPITSSEETAAAASRQVRKNDGKKEEQLAGEKNEEKDDSCCGLEATVFLI